MRELIIDGADLRDSADFYDAFFRVVGAPVWHGRNFNALRDSIAVGQINAVEAPYRIVIRNVDHVHQDAAKIVSDFISLIQELALKGCPVEVRVEAKPSLQ